MEFVQLMSIKHTFLLRGTVEITRPYVNSEVVEIHRLYRYGIFRAFLYDYIKWISQCHKLKFLLLKESLINKFNDNWPSTLAFVSLTSEDFWSPTISWICTYIPIHSITRPFKINEVLSQNYIYIYIKNSKKAGNSMRTHHFTESNGMGIADLAWKANPYKTLALPFLLLYLKRTS